MLDEELLYSVLKENGPTLELSNECSIANGDGVVNSIRGPKRRFKEDSGGATASAKRTSQMENKNNSRRFFYSNGVSAVAGVFFTLHRPLHAMKL